ncbi:hypothetical protein BHM03_00028219 [Ensete ventricosum]|nr:hypothetical protein BHM03_00028219 [Ensete ventricosum]
MGVLRSTASLEAEIEEMRETLLLSGGSGRADVAKAAGPGGVRRRVVGDGGDGDARTVCVTGGISFIGFAVVNRLLDRGYTVRLALQTQAEGDGDVWRDGQGRSVGGDGQRDGLGELVPSVRRLRRGVPYLKRGRSGGSIWLHGEPSLFLVPCLKRGCPSHCHKHMAEKEVRAAELVVEACVRAQSVRRCVFTSSLAACVWRENTCPRSSRRATIVDENCWSDQSV